MPMPALASVAVLVVSSSTFKAVFMPSTAAKMVPLARLMCQLRVAVRSPVTSYPCRRKCSITSLATGVRSGTVTGITLDEENVGSDTGGNFGNWGKDILYTKARVPRPAGDPSGGRVRLRAWEVPRPAGDPSGRGPVRGTGAVRLRAGEVKRADLVTLHLALFTLNLVQAFPAARPAPQWR